MCLVQINLTKRKNDDEEEEAVSQAKWLLANAVDGQVRRSFFWVRGVEEDIAKVNARRAAPITRLLRFFFFFSLVDNNPPVATPMAGSLHCFAFGLAIALVKFLALLSISRSRNSALNCKLPTLGWQAIPHPIFLVSLSLSLLFFLSLRLSCYVHIHSLFNGLAMASALL